MHTPTRNYFQCLAEEAEGGVSSHGKGAPAGSSPESFAVTVSANIRQAGRKKSLQKGDKNTLETRQRGERTAEARHGMPADLPKARSDQEVVSQQGPSCLSDTERVSTKTRHQDSSQKLTTRNRETRQWGVRATGVSNGGCVAPPRARSIPGETTEREMGELGDTGEATDSEPCEVLTLERPHRSSYYLPGKVEGRPVSFLLDTGCNTNLLSRKAFNALPSRIKKLLEENEKFGLLADGSRLPFHGIIRLTGRVRDVPIEENLL